MPGFTAINASTLNTPDYQVPTPPEVEATVSGAQKANRRRQPARKKPAAKKDDEQVVADASARAHISGKGRKRASHPSDEPEPKRRKSGSMKSSMPTTKTAVSATTTADLDENINAKANCSSTDVGLVSLTSMAKLNGFRYTRAQAAASAGNKTDSTSSTSISYAPETSMSSFRQSLPQTTMQAVRDSSRGGSLLYSSSAALPSTAQGVKLDQAHVFPTPTPRPASDCKPMTRSFRGQLLTPVASDAPTESNEYISQQTSRQEIHSDVEDFGDSLDEDDEEVIELAKLVEKSGQMEKSPPSRARKLNIRDTHEHDDYGGALLSEEERKLLDAIKVPQDTRKPIARAKFPPPIMDRSSLFGVSNTNALRTCFRVGEALNAGCQAVRNNRSLILELFARITSSWREPKPSRKQHFIINDLYHDKPPVINGTFDLWDQSALWEQDSRAFLTAGAEGIMCRMIARMKRDGTKWRLEILSIWQADWEDVEHVAGIYAKPVAVEAL